MTRPNKKTAREGLQGLMRKRRATLISTLIMTKKINQSERNPRKSTDRNNHHINHINPNNKLVERMTAIGSDGAGHLSNSNSNKNSKKKKKTGKKTGFGSGNLESQESL